MRSSSTENIIDLSPGVSIVLATINAKYMHTSLALKYLKANLEEFAPGARILEFTLQERAADIAEKILRQHPSIVLLSCYIWNISLTSEVVRIIRSVHPDIVLILGGPEVSFPTDQPDICKDVDHVICGEGESILPAVLRGLSGPDTQEKNIIARPNDVARIRFPYDLYTEEDISHRLVYVESSRGCAFGCEFCLSSLDTKVRYFDNEQFICQLEQLWNRGARQFKFIDRTIHLSKASAILDFFSTRICPELFVHFEIVPDQITEQLVSALRAFPPGAIQLEAGVQTFTPHVSTRIGRKQNMDKTEAALRKIVRETGVHIHSDLVIGLPGETVETLAQSFNRLIHTGAHEIQVGVLKRLRGAPISRHTDEYKMVYNESPPYEILQNRDISFADMQRLKRFSRYFDLVSNNGNFQSTAPLIWQTNSPFTAFLRFSDWLYSECGRTASIALDKLAEYIFDYLTLNDGFPKEQIADCLRRDFVANGRRKQPKCVREFASHEGIAYSENSSKGLPERQQRHKQ
ncbi:MAG: DUF4080 domain-containing protein [Deltaproteobacteria bacterium]|nr:DUF4080 domain-containing protein [Deltaproteobacteria bacterium]MBN2670545.1 DUF4080 domain-containing protein [Deltaproteobacteria bacterium]